MSKPKRKQVKKKAPKENKAVVDLSNNQLIKWLFAASALILGVMFFPYLFGKEYFLFGDVGSDTVNAFWPQLVESNLHMRQWGLPTWSFHTGIGQDIFPDTFGDPFKLIYYAMSAEAIPDAIAWVELLKFLVLGFLVYRWTMCFDTSNHVRFFVIMALTFSGFMTLGAGWYVFSSKTIFLVLLLLGIEYSLNKNTSWVLALAVFLIAVSQPFYLFLFGLAGIVYLLIRLTTEKEGIQVKRLPFIPMVWAVLTGLASSAIVAYANILQIQNSPRGSHTGAAEKLHGEATGFIVGAEELLTGLYRFIGNTTTGNARSYEGIINYLEAPAFYASILALLLLPLAYRRLKGSKKTLAWVLTAAAVLILVVPKFREALWLQSGNYYRELSLLLAIALCFAAAVSLKHIARTGLDRSDRRSIMITGGFILVLLFGPWSSDLITENGVKVVVVLFVVIYVGLLTQFRSTGDRNKFSRLLMLVLVLELAYNGYRTYTDRDSITTAEMNSNQGYFDDSYRALRTIENWEGGDTSFYRVTKTFRSNPAKHESLNNSKIQNFNGVESYHSFNLISYIDYLDAYNQIKRREEQYTRWVNGVSENTPFYTLFNIKYVIRKREASTDHLLNLIAEKKQEVGTVSIHELKDPLPLIWQYDKQLARSEHDPLPTLKKLQFAYKACLLPFESEYLVSYDDLGITEDLNVGPFQADMKNLVDASGFQLSSFQPDHIEGQIDLKPGVVCSGIPYAEGWHLYINGNEKEIVKVNGGLIGCMNEETGNSEIRIEYRPLYLQTSVVSISVIGLLSFFFMITLPFIQRKRKTSSEEL